MPFPNPFITKLPVNLYEILIFSHSTGLCTAPSCPQEKPKSFPGRARPCLGLLSAPSPILGLRLVLYIQVHCFQFFPFFLQIPCLLGVPTSSLSGLTQAQTTWSHLHTHVLTPTDTVQSIIMAQTLELKTRLLY